MNNITLIGRLTDNPELKQTTSGVNVCRFTLAVDRPRAKEKKTDFIPVTVWRSTAEFVSRYFRKGQKIALTGCLTTEKYEDKETHKNRTAYTVVADNVEFCESKQSSEQVTEQPEATEDNISTEYNFEEVIGDSDLPF